MPPSRDRPNPPNLSKWSIYLDSLGALSCSRVNIICPGKYHNHLGMEISHLSLEAICHLPRVIANHSGIRPSWVLREERLTKAGSIPQCGDAVTHEHNIGLRVQGLLI